MSNWTIFPRWSKHLLISKTYIIYSWIMSDELCLYTLSINVPYGACSIYRTSSNHWWILNIPIKRSNWSTIIRINISENFMFLVSISLLLLLPNPQIFCGCCKYIFSISFYIRYPHYLCRRKFMFKFIYFSKSFIWLFKI